MSFPTTPKSIAITFAVVIGVLLVYKAAKTAAPSLPDLV